MYFPKLQNGQYAVVKLKIRLGCLPASDEKENLSRGLWRVFDSLASARNYAEAAVAARPWIECNIYNARQHLVQGVRIFLPSAVSRPYKSLQAA